MSTLNICPCCSNSLLRHVGNHREYFFCRHCWAEMPNLENVEKSQHNRSPSTINLSINLTKLNRLVLAN